MALSDTILGAMDRFIGRLGYIKASEVPRMAQLAQLLFTGEGQPYTQSFITQTEIEAQKLAMSNPWAYSNIMLIAKRVAMGRLMTQIQDSAGEWQEDPKHELTKIFEQQPNPYMGQMYVWMYQTFWLMLQGEAYWMQVPDQTGKLAQIYPLPANRLEPIASKDALIAGFWYYPTATGKPEVLPSENVIFNRLPNPFNYNRGLSPLNAYYLGLQISREEEKFNLDDFQQGMTLKHILSLRPEISDPDALRFKKEINDAVAAGNRYMIVRGGDIKAAPLSQRKDTSPSDNTQELSLTKANYVYGVPEGLRTSTATEANATVAERGFIADTIWPLMLLFSEDITVQSVIPYYGDDTRVRFEDPRIANIELEIKTDKHSWEYMTYDEVRESKGLDPYYDPEIGKHKFMIVDELIKIAFEAELDQAEKEAQLKDKESQLNEREQALVVQPADEDEPGQIPEAFLEFDIEDKAVRKSEMWHWLERGYLPDPFNGKHSAHNQLSHGRRFSGSGSSRTLVSGRDPVSTKELGKKDQKPVAKKPSVAAKKEAKPKNNKKMDDIFDKAPKGSEQNFTNHLTDKMINGEITLQEGQQLRQRFIESQGQKVSSSPKVGDTPDAKKFTQKELNEGEATKQWKSWDQNLSTQEKTALKAYSSEPFDELSTNYIDMNNHLRGKDKSPSKETRQAIKQVDAAIAKGDVQQETTVFRGFPPRVLGDDPSKMIGKTITDKAYTSTSLSERVAGQFGNTVAEIRIPKGAKAGLMDATLSKADLKQLGRDPEHELLLPRNSKFRILSSQKAGKKTKVIMELVQ